MSAARGTVIKRGKRYSVIIDMGRGPNGKRIRKWHSGFVSKKEAEHARTEILSKIDRGTYIHRSSESVASFAETMWFPFLDLLVGGGTLKQSTASNYRWLLGAYVEPELGHVPLADLTSVDLNTFYGKILKSGRRHVRVGQAASLSAATVRLVHRTVHRMLSDAVKWDILSKNVADNASPPKPPQGIKGSRATWSPHDLNRFISATKDDRLGAMWLLFCTTGLRRGEAAGLRWSDVDLEAGVLEVRQARTVVDHRVVTGTPKTASSLRSLGLDGETVRALNRLAVLQKRERGEWGGNLNGSDLLFVRENGNPVHPATITKMFHRIVKKQGLPKIRLHDVRHSYASAALEAGVPMKIVSDRLGHASIRITSDTYSHVRPDIDQAAAELIAGVILNSKP